MTHLKDENLTFCGFNPGSATITLLDKTLDKSSDFTAMSDISSRFLPNSI